MAKRTARRKTRTKRAGGRAARPKRKVRRAAPKRARAKKAAARAPKPMKPMAAPPRPTFGGPTVGGIGTPGPMTSPGDPTRRETPWGSRPHSEAEEEFGREDDDEPM